MTASTSKPTVIEQPVNKEEFKPNFTPLNQKYIEDVYQISSSILGQGSFGEVRLAKHLITQQTRVVKIVYLKDKDEHERKKIVKEIDVMMELDHPNTVKLYEYFLTHKAIFIIMEYLPGGELFDKIIKSKNFSENVAREYMHQILQGVNYLHSKGIVHRDLKPENILFNSQGQLKLVDFGTSKDVSKNKMKNTYGTAYYIAPEILQGNYDIKCDIWSCGVILYIFLTGKPPFNGANEDEILASVKKAKYSMNLAQFKVVSDQAKDLLQKMLTKNPMERPTAQECIDHPWFREFVGHENILLQDQYLKNLKSFDVKSKVQQAIYMFFVQHIMTQEEQKELIILFKKLDLNNDGVLSREELMDAFMHSNVFINKDELQKLIDQLDSNQNNALDYTEFVTAAMQKNEVFTEERIRQCFKLFDINGDGTISVEEFKTILQGKQNLSMEFWEKMIQKIDSENVKEDIDYNTFKKIFISII